MQEKVTAIMSTDENLGTSLESIVRDSKALADSCASVAATAPDAALTKTLDFTQLVSGFPGTQQTALTALSDEFTGLFTRIGSFAQLLQTSVDSGTKPALDRTADARETVKEMNKGSLKLVTLVGEMIPGCAPGFKVPGKITKLLGPGLAKGKLSKGDTKKLASLVAEVVAERSKPEIAQSYAPLREQGLVSMERFCLSADKLQKHATACAHAMASVVSAIQTSFAGLAGDLTKGAESLSAIADSIDFQSDFSAFVKTNKIIRYDLQCSAFQPIDLSHPVFSDIDTRIRIVVPPVFPVGLAKVNQDFTSEGQESELSVSKGKYVLLMEPPTGDWVFVQNPMSRRTGYVPAAFIQQATPKLNLAIIMKTPDQAKLPQDVHVEVGAFVAVVGSHGEDGSASDIVTVRGEHFTLPREVYGVIYE
jgi:hypothetical protein